MEKVNDEDIYYLEFFKILFSRWNCALASENPKKVANLYSERGVLIPTMSNEIRVGKKEIEDYFEGFLGLSPKAILSEIYLGKCDKNFFTVFGKYKFQTKNGEVNAMYSFEYKKESEGWFIAHHHSSKER